jgi:hypothetical protein
MVKPAWRFQFGDPSSADLLTNPTEPGRKRKWVGLAGIAQEQSSENTLYRKFEREIFEREKRMMSELGLILHYRPPSPNYLSSLMFPYMLKKKKVKGRCHSVIHQHKFWLYLVMCDVCCVIVLLGALIQYCPKRLWRNCSFPIAFRANELAALLLRYLRGGTLASLPIEVLSINKNVLRKMSPNHGKESRQHCSNTFQ